MYHEVDKVSENSLAVAPPPPKKNINYKKTYNSYSLSECMLY
jgi:hypothetical protein